MILKSVMTKDPFYITPESTVPEAKAYMTKKGISKLPVIDKNGNLAGIVTRKDLMKAGPSEATTLDMFEISYLLSKLTVSKIMTTDVITVEETEVVEKAAKIMIDHDIGCLPVMKDGIMTGIITEGDLFELFTEIFGAHEKGVRAVIVFDDKPGALLSLINKIAEANGNIISLVTKEMENRSKRTITIKIMGIELAKVQDILSELSITAEDIREV